jgi:hypothetical protein
MTRDRANFDDLIAAANHAVVALDGMTRRDGCRATAPEVDDGKRAYSQLLDYRGAVRMTMAENALLQDALDVLRARLKFFGESL